MMMSNSSVLREEPEQRTLAAHRFERVCEPPVDQCLGGEDDTSSLEAAFERPAGPQIQGFTQLLGGDDLSVRRERHGEATPGPTIPAPLHLLPSGAKSGPWLLTAIPASRRGKQRKIGGG